MTVLRFRKCAVLLIATATALSLAAMASADAAGRARSQDHRGSGSGRPQNQDHRTPYKFGTGGRNTHTRPPIINPGNPVRPGGGGSKKGGN
jgi:hypothetical protein